MTSSPTPDPQSTTPAPRRDFEQWEAELPRVGPGRPAGWVRRRITGPVVKWMHWIGHSALAPEMFR